MIEIKVTLDASPGLLAALNAIAGGVPVTSSNGSASKPATKTATTAPVKDETATGGDVKLEDLRSLVHDKANSGKKTEVKALLKEFGVPNVSSLPEDKYADFKTQVTAL